MLLFLEIRVYAHIYLCVAVQVLDLTKELSDVARQQYAFNRQSSIAVISIYRHLFSARHAAVRWKVRLRRNGGHTTTQL